MARVDPILLPLVTDMERGLRELGVPFAVVGALVPELLLDAKPRRATNDADVMVAVDALDEFDSLKNNLDRFGFTRTAVPHRMQHGSGGSMDILPFSDAIAPDGSLELEEGRVLNVAGFNHVVPHAVRVDIEGGPTLPLAPLPLYILLKFVAYNDRKAHRDLASVLHCLRHYLDSDERRYGAEHEGSGVPFEYTCAYLLGCDGRPFLDQPLRTAVRTVLDRFSDPDAEIVDAVAREEGRILIEDEDRNDIFNYFRWYRLGANP